MIYFDNASTTKVEHKVLEKMVPYFCEHYGNPSSKHQLGYEARKAIEKARVDIAKTINAEPHQIIFTSGGTESNNLVLNNFYNIMCTTIEHHSVLNNINIIKKIQVDNNGKCLFDVDGLNGCDLVSVIYVNNEIGTVQDIKNITKECHKYYKKVHIDAVQAYGHIPIDVKELDIDYMSVSGHKIGAPKGIGFIYVKDISSLDKNKIAGGNQEFGLRSGTENVPSIIGLAEACKIAHLSMSRNLKVYDALYKHLRERLEEFPNISINAYNSDNVKYIASLRIDGIQALQMVEYLNENSIAVSSGSACASDDNEPSHILKAIGLSREEANNSIRLSFNPHNTYKEIDCCMEVIKEFIEINREVQERDRSQRPTDREETPQE